MTTSGETVLYIGAEEHHIGPYPADQVDKAWSSGILSTTESSAHAFFYLALTKFMKQTKQLKIPLRTEVAKITKYDILI